MSAYGRFIDDLKKYPHTGALVAQVQSDTLSNKATVDLTSLAAFVGVDSDEKDFRMPAAAILDRWLGMLKDIVEDYEQRVKALIAPHATPPGRCLRDAYELLVGLHRHPVFEEVKLALRAYAREGSERYERTLRDVTEQACLRAWTHGEPWLFRRVENMLADGGCAVVTGDGFAKQVLFRPKSRSGDVFDTESLLGVKLFSIQVIDSVRLANGTMEATISCRYVEDNTSSMVRSVAELVREMADFVATDMIPLIEAGDMSDEPIMRLMVSVLEQAAMERQVVFVPVEPHATLAKKVRSLETVHQYLDWWAIQNAAETWLHNRLGDDLTAVPLASVLQLFSGHFLREYDPMLITAGSALLHGVLMGVIGWMVSPRFDGKFGSPVQDIELPDGHKAFVVPAI
jgi:hypothetical protein